MARKKPQLPTASTVKSYVKLSIPRVQQVFFELRELIRTPKEQWTQEQRQWWSSVNIALGQLESDIENGKLK